MSNKTLVVALRSPAELYIGAEGDVDGAVLLGNVRTRSGFPPWPSAADLLINRETRELCGVSYLVPPEYETPVRTWASTLDERCVRFVEGRSVEQSRLYAGSAADVAFLEFRWSAHKPNEVVTAQLGGDLWYYVDEIGEQRMSLPRVVGYGIGDLQEVLQEHGLVLPARFALPRTLTVRALTPERTSL